MEYIGIEKFGSFLDNGAAYTIPDRPWFTDNYPGSLSERGKGNIRAIADRHEISLGNTLSNENSQIPWIHLKDGLKHIYVCKQVLATNISWDYLNERNMIYGTPVTIDGKDYKLRVLAENEWIGIIRNVYNISGLPMPTQEDLTDTNTYGQLDGQHNQLWNWWGIWTTCQETISGSVMERGYSNVNKVTYYSASASFKDAGWRPVLEYIEIDPPEKPTIITPKGEVAKPQVIGQSPIEIETEFNNPGGVLKSMTYTIHDIYLNKQVANATVSSTKTSVDFKGEVGHRYQLNIAHTNTADQVSLNAVTYFMWGKLNKYKLSEPVALKIWENLKAYTTGQELIMKPQTFPETENSKIRLVPQVMNNLTVGGVTGNELEFSASTKTPVVGDKIIKDSEIYTISEIEQGVKPANIESIVYRTTDRDKPTISWSYRQVKKAMHITGTYICLTQIIQITLK